MITLKIPGEGVSYRNVLNGFLIVAINRPTPGFFFMEYTEQLNDVRWKEKRLFILRRDKFKCQICGYMGDRVNVHHLKYTGMAWEAPDEDLITLCRECHSKLHVDKWPVGKSIKEIIELCRKDS